MRTNKVTASGWVKWGKCSAHCIEPGDIVRLGRNFHCYKVVRVEELYAVEETVLHMDNGSVHIFNSYDQIEHQIKPPVYDFNDEARYAHWEE